MAILHSKQVSVVFVALAESLTTTAEVPGERFPTRAQRDLFPHFAWNGGLLNTVLQDELLSGVDPGYFEGGSKCSVLTINLCVRVPLVRLYQYPKYSSNPDLDISKLCPANIKPIQVASYQIDTSYKICSEWVVYAERVTNSESHMTCRFLFIKINIISNFLWIKGAGNWTFQVSHR